jgi:pimeloyl-ACP methyl ester carboxylesterase
MFFTKKITATIVAASIVIFLTSSATFKQPPAKGVKNIVLVHGAYADGSSWAKVVTLLQDKGFNVVSVQNPLTSLDDDVAATKRAIDQMDGPVLLAGHSSAGMVITEAGNHQKVAGLVYASALIPNDGQSVLDVVEGYPSAGGNGETRDDGAGFLTLSLKGIEENFVQDLPSAERRIVYATQGPWGKPFLTQKVTNAAWKTKPSWCIIASEDRSVSPELERAEAKMIKAKTLELKSAHVSMLSHPKEVAAFIMSAANSL